MRGAILRRPAPAARYNILSRGPEHIMGAIELWCETCGWVRPDPTTAEVHVNAHDGFRLLTVPCPACGQLLSAGGGQELDLALAGGACVRELRKVLSPLTTDDLLDLHELLADDDWCARLAAGDP